MGEKKKQSQRRPADLSALLTEYTQLLEKAQYGSKKAEKKLFKKLDKAIVKSDLHRDAKIVLSYFMKRISSVQKLREGVINPKSTQKIAKEERDFYLRGFVIGEKAYGYSVNGGEGEAFLRAADRYNSTFGGEVTASMAKTAYLVRTTLYLTDSFHTYQAEKEITALVTYFHSELNNIEKAIQMTVNAIHGESDRPQKAATKAVKTACSKQWDISAEEMDEVKIKYNLG